MWVVGPAVDTNVGGGPKPGGIAFSFLYVV